MLKVENVSQWAANTVSFEDVEPVYLRLSKTNWYELDDKHFRWVEGSSKLEEAWLKKFRSK